MYDELLLVKLLSIEKKFSFNNISLQYQNTETNAEILLHKVFFQELMNLTFGRLAFFKWGIFKSRGCNSSMDVLFYSWIQHVCFFSSATDSRREVCLFCYNIVMPASPSPKCCETIFREKSPKLIKQSNLWVSLVLRHVSAHFGLKWNAQF